MKKIVLLLSSLLPGSMLLQAQEDTISAERPSESQSPNLVPRRHLQFEAGVGKEASGPDYLLFHPRSTLRYGLSKKLELRVEIDAATEREASKHESAYGLQPLQVGFKTPLLQPHGLIPKTTFLAMAGLPSLAANDQHLTHVFPMLRLLMENKLANNFELDYNAGAEWDGESTHPRWMFSIEPQVSIGRRWQAFVEAYGRWQQGHGAEHVLDAGLGYFLSKNLKLDVVAGKGLSHEAPEYFVSTGLSFRFKM